MLQAEKMFDGYGIINNVSILVSEGIIKKIGKSGDFQGKVINAKFILPGLIDMHVHLSVYGNNYAKTLELFNYMSKMFLYNGITTVRDTGNYLNNIYNFQHLKIDKPNLFYSIFLDGEEPIWNMSFVLSDEKQAREIIDFYKNSGIKWVKAYKSIKPELLKVIITHAHSHGLKVAGDLMSTSPSEASSMKIDTLEHAMLLINGTGGKSTTSLKEIYEKWTHVDINSEEINNLINKLRETNTPVCSTLILTQMELFPSPIYSKYLKILFPLYKEYKKKRPKSRFAEIKTSDKRKAFKNILEFVRLLHKGKVRLIGGSDTTNPFVAPGFSLHQELKLLVGAGLTPIEALKTVTSEAANVLGDDKIGRIRPGCRADLVMLSEYADSDINNIDKITHVILNGKLIDSDMAKLDV